MAFLDENGVAQLWAAVKDRLAGAFDSVEFDIAEQAANLVSGDSIATAFGKLAKNYSSLLTSISDLNTSLGNRISEVTTNLTSQINTKLNKSDVLANYTTTATGKALDASLGPAIKTKMDLVDSINTNTENGFIKIYHEKTKSGSVQDIMDYYRNNTNALKLNCTRWDGGSGGLFESSSFITIGACSSVNYGVVLAITDNKGYGIRILCLNGNKVFILDMTKTTTEVTVT